MPDLPRHRAARALTADDATALIGAKADPRDPTPAAMRPGVWVDDDTDQAVLALLPCRDLTGLRRHLLSIADKALGMGTYRGSTGNRNVSITFGYRPRKPMMSQEGCVLTAFNRDYPAVAAYLENYAEALGDQLAALLPDVAEQSTQAIGQVLPDWRLGRSPWTSGVINRNSQLPYHRDGNNFDSWSVMPVIRRGVTGGHLHIPEYDLTVPCRDGIAVAFFGRRLVHGVTPMTQTHVDGYRLSVVYYALKGLRDCHSFAEETQYALKRRTEREASLAETGGAGIDPKPNPDTRPRSGAARFGYGTANPDRGRIM